MELNEITAIIGNGFFPVIMCGLLFWYMTKQNEYHKQETDSLKDAINELKIAITTLTDRIHGGEK